MGVDFSKERARPPLSIACVAEVAQFEVDTFQAFRAALKAQLSLSRQRSDAGFPLGDQSDAAASEENESHAKTNSWRAPDLSVEAFTHALEESSVAANDCAIFERMFGLMDCTGDEVIHSVELLIAVALIVKGDFPTRLKYAVDCLLSGIHDTLSPKHIFFLISTATTVANYFGDPLLPLPVLEGVAEDAFQELCVGIDVEAPNATRNPAMVPLLTEAVLRHPVVQDYISQDK